MSASDGEKREESKNNIKNTKKHQKTPKNTKKYQKKTKKHQKNTKNMKNSILLLGLSLGILQFTYAQDTPKIEQKQTIDVVPSAKELDRDSDLMGIKYHQIYLASFA